MIQCNYTVSPIMCNAENDLEVIIPLLAMEHNDCHKQECAHKIIVKFKQKWLFYLSFEPFKFLIDTLYRKTSGICYKVHSYSDSVNVRVFDQVIIKEFSLFLQHLLRNSLNCRLVIIILQWSEAHINEINNHPKQNIYHNSVHFLMRWS